MKKTLLLFILMALIGYYTHAQQKSEDRWHEVERRDAKKKKMNFTDTMYLNTKDRKNFGFSKTKESLLFKADIENAQLDFGHIVFEVKKNQADEIILMDESSIYHVFERMNINTEHQNAQKEKENMEAPANTVKSFDRQQFQGKWIPFKKYHKDGQNDKVSSDLYVRGFHILGDTIQVFLWKDTDNGSFYSLYKLDGGKVFVRNEEQNEERLFLIKRAEEREIIIEDAGNGMLYFLKRKDY